MISFDININNVFARRYCENETLCLTNYLPFIQTDIYASENEIKKEIFTFIKKQKHLLTKSKLKPKNIVFYFCTEPAYNSLINKYKNFMEEIIQNEFDMPLKIYLSCQKNNSVINIDQFFDYYLYYVNMDWDFLEQYECQKEKKFITLNNRRRQHRIDLKFFLEENNLLDSCFYSFNWENKFNFENNVKETKNFNITHIKQYGNFLKKLTMKNIKNYFVDDDLWTNKLLIDKFKKSYFYIITERDYSDECIFPTEKIYKSFLYKIPFILIGNPHTLKFLHTYGFRTFSPYINESYDNETNYEKRVEMIKDEIKRLLSLNMDNFLIDTKDIIEYNYNLIKRKKNEITI